MDEIASRLWQIRDVDERMLFRYFKFWREDLTIWLVVIKLLLECRQQVMAFKLRLAVIQSLSFEGSQQAVAASYRLASSTVSTKISEVCNG